MYSATLRLVSSILSCVEFFFSFQDMLANAACDLSALLLLALPALVRRCGGYKQIPMAVVIQPMALTGPKEPPVVLVDFGELQMVVSWSSRSGHDRPRVTRLVKTSLPFRPCFALCQVVPYSDRAEERRFSSCLFW